MVTVIVSFACKKTQLLFEKGQAEGFLRAIEKQAKRKLAMLHFSAQLEDLRLPPANHLEKLSGSRKGQYSIRINNQYRLCFRFEQGRVEGVEIIDYHR